jgi:caffeoyl-CoA O-methyltransferase
MQLVPEIIEAYVETHTSPASPLFEALAKETRETMQLHMMQVGNVEGSLLRMLVKLSGAKHALEIGTFTGYSALCIAEGLPDDGTLITCDIDHEATTIARRYWGQSPHGKKIELRLGFAWETIDALSGPFDFVFLDADKQNYVRYWEAVMPKVRSGGLIAADNVLWSGRVTNPREELDIAVDSFNKHALADSRVEVVMLTVRDGVTLARKR